jgi:Spy/CpxP family protein refolding chaperone
MKLRKEQTMKRNLIAAAIAAALFSMPAWAQQAGQERGMMGQGMMGGGTTGQGMMGGGMMGGMTGQGMTGQGMMGGGLMGRGMGHGMMGGGMMGGMMRSAMMGGGMGAGALVADLRLTEEQANKAQAIHDETRRKQWELMGRLMDEGSRMRDAFRASGTDRAAAEKAFKQINALREQMFAAHLDAQQKLEGVLTPEQRTRLRERVHGGGWMMMMQ